MNNLAIYDPAVAELEHEKLTEQMIGQINQHHRDTRRSRAMMDAVAALQKAQAAQLAQHTKREAQLYAQLQTEKKNAHSRARWGNIAIGGLLLGVSYGSLKAMELGLIHVNLALPLALASLIYSIWLASGLWHEFRRFR